jgi:hypothetical protein
MGATALLHDTRNYATVANGGVGIGFNTDGVGSRGAVSIQW